MVEKRMYSAVQRANTLSTIVVTNLAFFTFLLALSSYYFDAFSGKDPKSSVQVNTIFRFTQLMNYRRQLNDEVRFSIDIDADLRSLFHWNVKQLFVFVVATYSTPSNPHNEIVIWDHIIQSMDKAELHLHNVNVKYPLVDKGTGLRGANVTLTMQWNILPFSGMMSLEHGAQYTWLLPNDYMDLKRPPY